MEKGLIVCVASFGDGKFLGWCRNTQGELSDNEPKIFITGSDEFATLKSNYLRNVSGRTRFQSLYSSLYGTYDEPIIPQGTTSTKVELRIVKYPFNFGFNIDVNMDNYIDTFKTIYEQTLVKLNGIPAGINRIRAIKSLNAEVPLPPCNYYFTVPYSKVIEWASTQPQTFLDIINIK